MSPPSSLKDDTDDDTTKEESTKEGAKEGVRKEGARKVGKQEGANGSPQGVAKGLSPLPGVLPAHHQVTPLHINPPPPHINPPVLTHAYIFTHI